MFDVLKIKVLWGVSYSQRYTFFIIVQYAVFFFYQFLFPLSPFENKSPALPAFVSSPINEVKI